MGIFGDLWTYYWDGGIVMHFISLCSFVGVMAIIYKLIVFRKARINTNDFISRMRKALLNGDIDGAVKVCDQFKGPVPIVCKTGLMKYGSSRDEIEKAMENAAIHEVAYLEKWLVAIATVTNIAPLLGFFGTVIGMIISFDVISKQGLNNPGMVAHGISVALLTTAWGLIVAFVCQPFYNWFTGKVAYHIREMETCSNILFETLDEMQGAGERNR